MNLKTSQNDTQLYICLHPNGVSKDVQMCDRSSLELRVDVNGPILIGTLSLVLTLQRGSSEFHTFQ